MQHPEHSSSVPILRFSQPLTENQIKKGGYHALNYRAASIYVKSGNSDKLSHYLQMK